MNTLSKTLLAIISGLIIAVTGILLYVYWPAITGTINDSQYLTPEQGQELYDKGYNDGNTAKTEQLAQIAYYKQLTDDYYVQVNTLNNEISSLNSQIASKNTTITELTNIKNTNLQTIESLNEQISANETTINNLNTQISGLQGNKSSLETQISSLNADISNKQVIITGLNSQVTELQSDITTKRNQIVNLNAQISDLQSQLTELQNSSSSNSTQIESLNLQITTLTNEKTNLESSITNKDSQISSLNTQINTLNNDILDLEAQITSKENTISTLNNQITNLQTLNTQLSQTNQSNTNTITTLNSQIVSLNNQINSLSLQIQNNSSNVTTLNNRIAELEESISYYESFISGLQSETQVVATFMYDGSVYNIQVLNKNAYASVTNPESTTYMVFNGWKVGEQSVNLASYQVSSNTTFVADITYKYDVTFVVDNATYNSQIVVANNSPTLPTAPTKTGYEFDGWTVNETITTPNSYVITANTTFVAKFTKLYTVKFICEDETLSTQTIKSGNLATVPEVEEILYRVFNGWKVNNTVVDASTYIISADTTFVADITYKYEVKFIADGTIVNGGFVPANTYVVVPETNPSKTGYDFDGWTLDGHTVVNPSSILVTGNTTFIAKFTQLHTVTFTYDGEVKSTQTVRDNEYASNVTVADTTYKVFNGWKLNGSIVNVTNTQITADTTFVADITYKYDVVFKVDSVTYNSQIVTANNKATAPTNPSKTGYTFNGWTINGTDIVNLTNTNITGNTTFTAKFTINSYTVTFKYEDSTLSTQTVNYGSTATNVTASSTTYKVFNGWKLNGSIVNVANTTIIANTTFIADITYKYDVVFKVDDATYNSQIVVKNNYATIPTKPSKFGYTFDGWCLNGDVVVNVSEVAITENTTFTAKFTLNAYTVNFVSESIIINTQSVNANNYATLPTNPTKVHCKFAGWTTNGIDIIDVTTTQIVSDITFVAKFTYVEYGTFDDDGYVIMTWDELISNNVITVTDGKLSNTIRLSAYSPGTTMVDNISGNLVVPNTITVIDNYAFMSCGLLKTVTLPNSITKIARCAFANCYGLTNFTIPNSVTELGMYAFSDCNNITSITFESGCQITTLYAGTFEDCDSLTHFVVPSSVTLIEEDTFDDCDNLLSVYIPSSVTTMITDLDEGEVDCAPFVDCSKVVIYCQVTSAQSGWERYWNVASGKTARPTNYGYTLEMYYAAIGA